MTYTMGLSPELAAEVRAGRISINDREAQTEFIRARLAEEVREGRLFFAEVYRGSGRLTGHTISHVPRSFDGWVQYTSREEFEKDFTWQEHDHCHEPGQRASARCPHCKAAGWA